MPPPDFPAWVSSLGGARPWTLALAELRASLDRHPSADDIEHDVLGLCHSALAYSPANDPRRVLVDAEEHFIEEEAPALLKATRALLSKFNRRFPGDTTGFGRQCRFDAAEQTALVHLLGKIEKAMLRVKESAEMPPVAPWFRVAGGLKYERLAHGQSHVADVFTVLGFGLMDLFRRELGRPNAPLAALLVSATSGNKIDGATLENRVKALRRNNPGVQFAGFLTK